jgi:2-polyprenyl-3-methyl-5-hydroxy-6-metoxy-1,4-benzoquinol methylase
MPILRQVPQDGALGALRPHAEPGRVHPSHALRPLLRRLRRIEQPQVLDLGPAESVNIEFLTRRGCRVSVEDLAEALPPPAERRHPSSVQRPRVARVPQSVLAARRPGGELFDAVLCWDLLDLLMVEAARDLVLEIRPRLRPRGLVWALFDSAPRSSPAPVRRFRILGEDSLEHEIRAERPVGRFLHQNRDIIQMFDGFEVLSSTFLRVGMREMLFGRAAASSA